MGVKWQYKEEYKHLDHIPTHKQMEKQVFLCEASVE